MQISRLLIFAQMAILPLAATDPVPFSAAVEIRAPREVVWKILVEPSTGERRLPPGPTKIGTIYRNEEDRRMLRTVLLAEEPEFLVVGEEPNRFGITERRYRLRPSSTGTMLEVTVAMPRHFSAKETVQAHAEKIKEIAEADVHQPQS